MSGAPSNLTDHLWMLLLEDIAICSACPIRRECGTYAELAQPTAGLWAGTDYTEGTS